MYYLSLLRRHLFQYPMRTGMAFAVLAVAAAFMMALAGAGAGLQFRLGGYLESLFPREQLRLEAQRGALGPMAVETNPIREGLLEQARTQTGVEAVYGVEPVRFPISVSGNVLGNEIASDAIVHGVDEALVKGAIQRDELPWSAAALKEQGVVPVVASQYFLDMYNLGMARSTGMPLLSPNFVLGRHMTIHLGQSVVGLGGIVKNERDIRGRLVGLSNQPWLLGMAIPADLVRELNAEFAPNQEPYYVQIVVVLKDAGQREAFLAWAVANGLKLTGGEQIGQSLVGGVRWAGRGLIALAGLVFVLGVMQFNVVFGMVYHARRGDLFRLVALGMSPSGAAVLALGEVAVVAAGAVGVAFGSVELASRWAIGRLEGMRETVTWLPAEWFQPPTGWFALTGIVILIAAVVPTLPYLWSLLRAEPADVVRGM